MITEEIILTTVSRDLVKTNKMVDKKALVLFGRASGKPTSYLYANDAVQYKL